MAEKLIEVVRRHELLYNVQHSDYLNIKLKAATWKQIAKELRLNDGEHAKRAWEQLRNNHRDALRRQKILRAKGLADRITPWRYQESMEFLIPHMNTRTSRRKIFDQIKTDQSSDCSDDSSATSREGKKRRNDEDAIDNPFLDGDGAQDANEFVTVPNFPNIMNSVSEDPLYHFFMSMYETTKTMPPSSQHAIKTKIFALVAEEEATFLQV